MNCTIHFYLLNDHFSQEHADLHHNGEESEYNLRYEWEDELKITTNVTGVITEEYATYSLQGELDGKPFSHEIKNMRLFKFEGEIPTVVGCSESILDSYQLSSDGDIVLKVYLKDYEPMANPIPGIYIASQEFPKELIF